MTCMEVDKMNIKNIVKKVVFPVVATLVLTTLFHPLCVDNGDCDYVKLWMLTGIPFGVHRMYFWLIPRGFDIGGTVGMFVLNFLVGGIIGGIVLIWRLIMAVVYTVAMMGHGVYWIARKEIR